jgi:hypothetical protein
MFAISTSCFPAGVVARSDLVRHVMEQVSRLLSTGLSVSGACMRRCHFFGFFIHPESVLIGHDQFKAIQPVEAIGFLL